MDARLTDFAPFAPARTVDPAIPYHAHRDRLVAGHTALVRKIAWHVHARVSSVIEVEDLTQIGLVALIGAARTFVDRGEASFATYAAVRVRGAMVDELRKHATLSRGALKRRREIGEARSVLAGESGAPPSDEALAGRLGMTLSAFRLAEAGTHGMRQESIDEVYSDHAMWFADETPGADEQIDRDRLRRRLADAISGLPAREQQVLSLYFIEELNLEEIGEVLGVGGARVCQIKRTALDKVRLQLQAAA